MVNINAQLPSAATIPFHPATESIHRENLNKPVIPKTEIISSYNKLRDEQERNPFSTQTRSVLQNESEQSSEQPQHQDSPPEQRRALFFARRGELSEAEKGKQSLLKIDDFTVIISVIQARYRNAVSPLPEPNVNQIA